MAMMTLHEYDTDRVIAVDTDEVEGVYLKVIDVSGDIVTRLDLVSGDVIYVKESYENVYQIVTSGRLMIAYGGDEDE